MGHDAEAADAPLLPESKRVLLKRGVAGCLAFIALWFVVGSFIAPYCAYGYIWRLSLSDNPCWLGFGELSQQPYLLFGLLILLVILEKAEKFIRDALLQYHVQPWVDQHWKSVSLFSLAVCIATAGAVYAYANDGYDFWVATQSLEVTVGDNSQSDEPKIEAPLDFLFIDDKSVDALYNQVEPELIEKHRTVSNSGRTSGKAGIDTRGITASMEAEKGSGSTGAYERIEFAPARRCLAVMQFVAESKRAAYYTNFSDWRRAREEQVEVNLQPETAGSPTTKQATDKARVAMTENEPAQKNAFLKELQGAAGLVFLRGQFSQSPGPQPGTLVLTSEFPGAPKKVSFKVIVPREPDTSDALRLAAGANLLVFGRIIKPLTESGTVEIRPFAIF